MAVPKIAPWNLALRFGLELMALAGFAVGGWALGSGLMRWVLALTFPVAVATVWGTFNVADDPSRSGGAPVAVGGRTRLIIEFAVLGVGAAGLALGGRPIFAIGYAFSIVLHYVTTLDRVRWLVERPATLENESV